MSSLTNLKRLTFAKQYRKYCKLGHDCRRMCSHRRRDSTGGAENAGVEDFRAYSEGAEPQPPKYSKH